MRRTRASAAIALVLLATLLPAALGGCAIVSSFEPPDWAWFDPVLYTAGGVPASLGYYLGVAVWSPVGLIFAALLPYPIDETIPWAPGEGIGIVLGLALGAPFHLLALPFRAFGDGGEEAVVAPTAEDPAPGAAEPPPADPPPE